MSKYLLVWILFAAWACSDKTGISIENEKTNILKLHELQREYHFNKDSVAFANQLSDNFISVNKGVISFPSRKETISRYHQYFSSVSFNKWDDISEPIIIISDDGKMAYTIVDKLVNISYEDEAGQSVESETHFAWTAIYRKYGDKWLIDCVTSTDKRD